MDFATDTPRDAKFPYLPAEAYPFTSPYTAEEMGFRSMEFPHMPRWNCVQIEDGGVLTPTGYLTNLKIIALVNYREPAGLLGHLTAEPGELLSRWLTQDLAPPENYGNQLLFLTYRTDKDGSLTDVAAKDLKMMGDAYAHYNPDGSVSTHVVEAQPKAE